MVELTQSIFSLAKEVLGRSVVPHVRHYGEALYKINLTNTIKMLREVRALVAEMPLWLRK